MAPIEPVTERLHGITVTDNYRNMEALDPTLLAWIKAEGAGCFLREPCLACWH